MTSHPNKVLALQAQLAIDHPTGTIQVTSEQGRVVQVRFADPDNFRAFFRQFRIALRPGQVRDWQELIDQQQLTLNVQIGEKQVLALRPGRRPKIAFANLLPQYLLLWLGR